MSATQEQIGGLVTGVVSRAEPASFWSKVKNGILNAAKTHGMQVHWKPAADDPSSGGQESRVRAEALQATDLLEFQSRHVHAIIVCPLERRLMSEGLKKMARGWPVVLLESDVDGDHEAITLSCDGNEEAAENLGTQAVETIRAMLRGEDLEKHWKITP